jgi:predicted amidohydrolase YtcJ
MKTWVSAAVLISVLAAPVALAAERADVILLNGKIVTVDERFSMAQGLAVRGERILAVGKNADVLEHQGPGTRVIDLRGRP